MSPGGIHVSRREIPQEEDIPEKIWSPRTCPQEADVPGMMLAPGRRCSWEDVVTRKEMSSGGRYPRKEKSLG